MRLRVLGHFGLKHGHRLLPAGLSLVLAFAQQARDFAALIAQRGHARCQRGKGFAFRTVALAA